MRGRKRRGCGNLLAALLLLGGCGTVQKMAIQKDDYLTTNALTYEHPFTDAGAARARRDAERDCGYRKKAAVKTGGTCSLRTCTTHFQCMDAADAENYKQ
jgi:uncharacterized protein YceK